MVGDHNGIDFGQNHIMQFMMNKHVDHVKNHENFFLLGHVSIVKGLASPVTRLDILNALNGINFLNK
jgi:hypothetical protein